MNSLKIPKKKSEIFRLNRVGQIYLWKKPESAEITIYIPLITGII